MKKSQITMFIIVGVLIVITAGLVYYMAGYISKKQAEKQAKLAEKSTDIKNSVETFVNACAEKTLVDGVKLLGSQGGIIYKNQVGNGNIINPSLPITSTAIKGLKPLQYKPTPLSEQNYILYAIDLPAFPADGMTSFNYKNPEYLYPWKCFPYLSNDPTPKSLDENANCNTLSNDIKTFELDDGSFGQNILLPLLAPSNIPSINSTLTLFIENNLSTCLQNFNTFKERGLIVNTQAPKATLTINNDNILLKLKMPTTITKMRTNEQATIETYTINAPIRLGRVYEFTNKLIINDTTNISFSIDKIADYSTLSNYDAKISVTKTDSKNPSHNDHDDIITIKDTGSRIGDGFSFTFARKNRRPALHYDLTIAKIKNPDGKISLEKLKNYVSDPDEDFDTLTEYSLRNFKFKSGTNTANVLKSGDGDYEGDRPITGTLKNENQLTVGVTDHINPSTLNSEGYSDSQKI